MFLLQAFSRFVDQHKIQPASDDKKGNVVWHCCGTDYSELRIFHKHVAFNHKEEIEATASQQKAEDVKDGHNKVKNTTEDDGLPVNFSEEDVYQWLPKVQEEELAEEGEGRILLFYTYRLYIRFYFNT